MRVCKKSITRSVYLRLDFIMYYIYCVAWKIAWSLALCVFLFFSFQFDLGWSISSKSTELVLPKSLSIDILTLLSRYIHSSVWWCLFTNFFFFSFITWKEEEAATTTTNSFIVTTKIMVKWKSCAYRQTLQ